MMVATDERYSAIIEEIPREERICVRIEHPNGTSDLFFDGARGAFRIEPAYAELLHVLKDASAGDGDKRRLDFTQAISSLNDSGHLLFWMEYPGLYPDDLGQFAAEDGRGDIITYFDGQPWTLDSVIVTDLPM